jgi:cyclic-di-GMP-binding biofilm dispersal mediator protein
MVELATKNILVVGASGALGGQITSQLLAAGANVLGTASTIESAERIPAGVSLRLVLDLANPASIAGVADHLLSSGSELDGVVLASGLVGFGSAFDTAPASAATLMQVNYLGQAELISRLLPSLTTRAAETGSGFIAGISGLVAEKAFLGMSAYSASKSAFSSYLAGLGIELRRHKITVLDARPGHTETGLAGRAIFGTAPAFPAGMTAEHVASVIVAGIVDGKRELASTDF